MDEKLKKYEGLIELTRTTEEIVKFEEEIDLILQNVYRVDKQVIEEALEKHVRVRVAMEIRKLFAQEISSNVEHSNLDTSSKMIASTSDVAMTHIKKEDIKAILSSAYRTICALPILQMTLAFEPSEAVIGNISRWARQTLAPGILLDLSLDRSILGGAIIIYQGKFFDYSLRKKLQAVFEKGELKLS